MATSVVSDSVSRALATATTFPQTHSIASQRFFSTHTHTHTRTHTNAHTEAAAIAATAATAGSKPFCRPFLPRSLDHGAAERAGSLSEQPAADAGVVEVVAARELAAKHQAHRRQQIFPALLPAKYERRC